MKTIRIKDPDDVFRMPAILHLEAGGTVEWPKVGTCAPEPITGTLFVMTPAKGKPVYHRSATKVLEHLHIASGIKLHNC